MDVLFRQNAAKPYSQYLFMHPRGRNRIYDLGIQIAQMYLSPLTSSLASLATADQEGVLIRGMFPGLELTNDDGGVNVRPLPLMDQDSETGFFHAPYIPRGHSL